MPRAVGCLSRGAQLAAPIWPRQIFQSAACRGEVIQPVQGAVRYRDATDELYLELFQLFNISLRAGSIDPEWVEAPRGKIYKGRIGHRLCKLQAYLFAQLNI